MSDDPQAVTYNASIDSCMELPSSYTLDNSPGTVSRKTKRNSSGSIDGDLDDFGGMWSMMENALEEDRFGHLMDECSKQKTENAGLRKQIEVLEKRLARAAANSECGEGLNATFQRLNKLERENNRLKLENIRLEVQLQENERKNTMLNNENEGKSRKLRGANKKVIDAKQVAAKEGQKANEAVQKRDERLKLQRQQRDQMNKANAKVAEKEKTIQDLLSELDTERSGDPHLRDNGSVADQTIAAFSISLKIDRRHFPLIKGVLADSRATTQNRIREWYGQWKKPQDKQVVGAVYTDAPGTRIGVDLNEDLVELLGEEDGYPQTGAEHNGRRSMRALGAIDRQAMDIHNSTG